jgi:hypothetical protein
MRQGSTRAHDRYSGFLSDYSFTVEKVQVLVGPNACRLTQHRVYPDESIPQFVYDRKHHSSNVTTKGHDRDEVV